jgi:hypothetical protein
MTLKCSDDSSQSADQVRRMHKREGARRIQMQMYMKAFLHQYSMILHKTSIIMFKIIA